MTMNLLRAFGIGFFIAGVVVARDITPSAVYLLLPYITLCWGLTVACLIGDKRVSGDPRRTNEGAPMSCQPTCPHFEHDGDTQDVCFAETCPTNPDAVSEAMERSGDAVTVLYMLMGDISDAHVRNEVELNLDNLRRHLATIQSERDALLAVVEAAGNWRRARREAYDSFGLSGTAKRSSDATNALLDTLANPVIQRLGGTK